MITVQRTTYYARAAKIHETIRRALNFAEIGGLSVVIAVFGGCLIRLFAIKMLTEFRRNKPSYHQDHHYLEYMNKRLYKYYGKKGEKIITTT